MSPRLLCKDSYSHKIHKILSFNKSQETYSDMQQLITNQHYIKKVNYKQKLCLYKRKFRSYK